jgi:hypothetical protein
VSAFSPPMPGRWAARYGPAVLALVVVGTVLCAAWAVPGRLAAPGSKGLERVSAAAVPTAAHVGSVVPANFTGGCPNASEFDAQIDIEEDGLAYGTWWTVNLTAVSNGTVNNTTNSSSDVIILVLPSGCYNYTIPAVAGYLQSYSGNFSVLGSVQLFVNFTAFPEWAPTAALVGIALWSVFVTGLAVYWVRRR